MDRTEKELVVQMILKKKIPADFYKLFRTKNREAYMQFVTAIYEENNEVYASLGLTQEEFAEKTGFTANYISTLERGASFPRCENLILLLNALEVSADAIFCDVLDHTTEYKATQLSNELGTLSVDAQNRILQIVELLIRQEKENEK